MKTDILIGVHAKDGSIHWHRRSNKKGKVGIKINLYESGPVSIYFIDPEPVYIEKNRGKLVPVILDYKTHFPSSAWNDKI